MSRKAELPALSSSWGSLARHASAGTWTALSFTLCQAALSFGKALFFPRLWVRVVCQWHEMSVAWGSACQPSVFSANYQDLRGYLSFSVPNLSVLWKPLPLWKGQGVVLPDFAFTQHTHNTHMHMKLSLGQKMAGCASFALCKWASTRGPVFRCWGSDQHHVTWTFKLLEQPGKKIFKLVHS